MANVICKYCGKQFNREAIPFVQIPAGTRFRYAHPDCYKQAKENGLEKNDYPIVDPKIKVLCCFCGSPLLKTDKDCVQLGEKRFAHLLCHQQDLQKEKTPKEKLFQFIMEQFGYEFVPPGMQKQIENLLKENNLTYSGIHGSLKYFYIIKHNPKNRENPLGIVPYIYQEAADFFQKVAEARSKNKILISDIKNEQEVHITIKRPKIEKKVSKEFSFLDVEGDNE